MVNLALAISSNLIGDRGVFLHWTCHVVGSEADCARMEAMERETAARADAAQPGSLPDQAALARAVRARVAQLPLRQRDSLQQAVGAQTWQLVQLAVVQKEQGLDLGL